MPEYKSESLVSSRQTLLVWDADGSPPAGEWTTVLWNGFGDDNDTGVISIPTLVEGQAYALRKHYLAWIYELGESFINGKRLVDQLELLPGFSYWWMTSLAQKFNASGTSQIDNAIKLFVLESLISEYKPDSIELISGNDRLASTMQCLCQNLQLRFTRKPVRLPEKTIPLARRIYCYLPGPVQALIYFLWYLLRSLPLLSKKHITTSEPDGEMTFIDVLVHLDRKAFTTGKFISNYWTILVDKLLCSNIKTNWFHNYFTQTMIPTPLRAEELVGLFNKCARGMQSHKLIESNLSLAVLVKALKNYFRLCWSSYKLPDISSCFKPADSAVNFWPLFENEWSDSLSGQSAMVNSLRISLYEKTFSSIPCQQLGIYIQENQPWEMALIYFWKSAGHGKLIGVPHTTVRFWDLRYFYDSRSYKCDGKNVLQIPDLVAVNGPAARKAYLEGGYPVPLVTEVEALRFTHLLNRPLANSIISEGKMLKVLICGDFLSATNDKMLSWIEIASWSLPPETTYYLKPHPAYPVDLSSFPSLTLTVSDATLAELFKMCDVVFTSNITSSSVDAYCSGTPVVQMLDGATLNLSPLRGLKGVHYVTNPRDLAKALSNAKRREGLEAEPFFCLDKELPRWQNLLGISPADVRYSTVA